MSEADNLAEELRADAYGHGTACAGIIRSLAPQAELYSVKVLSADTTGRSGNSFAAPHIAGVVARILGRHPTLSVPQVKMILQALSANVVHD